MSDGTSFAVVRAVDCRCGEHLVAANDIALAALLGAHVVEHHPECGDAAASDADACRRAWIAEHGYWELAPAWKNTRRDE